MVFRIVFSLAFLCSLSVWTHAQDTSDYSSDEVSFKYPSTWALEDRSQVMIRQLNLSPKDGNALLMVLIYRKPLGSDREFSSLKAFNVKPRVGQIAKDFSTYTESGTCVEMVGHAFPGQRLEGKLNGEPTTLTSFSFVINGQFVNLIYLRNDKDAARFDPAWSNIVNSLRLNGKKKDKELILYDNESDSFLNGKAVSLPRPIWPSGIKSFADNIVDVRITINEDGKVIAAEAVSGDIRFRSQAVMAAKLAKFTPAEICGKVSQISGLVRYRFVR